jgi:CAAX protease family protein
MPRMNEASIPPPPPPAAADGSEPSPRRPAGEWGPWLAVAGIAILILIVAVEAGIVGAFDPKLKSLGAKLALQALLAGTLVAVSFAVVSLSSAPRPLSSLGLRRPDRPVVRLAFTAYVAYFAFAIAYSALVNPHQKDITRDLGYGHGVLTSVAVGALIVLAAPISEEIFFRGFVFGGLRQRLPFVLSAVISAAIFGAFHYTGPHSLTVLPQLAALGLAQAWLYERSGSIYPTIAVHLANNAIAFSLLTH